MESNSDEVRKINENVIRLQEQVAVLQNTVKDLVTRVEFTPVKVITFGLAGTILTSVLGALLAKVIIK